MSMLELRGDTIAAVATPNAVGGISVVRISGPDALAVADRIFRTVSGRPLASYKGYTAAYGHILRDGETLDDGIATVFKAPHSYTGEDVVEISCHGGLLVTRDVLRAALREGARLAGPGEFTRRAFLNGKLSLTQAEAVADLIGASSEQSVRAARSAMDGALYRKIHGITEDLLGVSAHLAAYIDYPEEDVEEVTGPELLEKCRESLSALRSLLQNFDRGRLMREGVDTVIVGKPNVGKSTLMNLLSGCDRSIVTDIPGTTRDIVEETVNLGDVVLRLADTAGIRDTENLVERIGVDIALGRLQKAELAIAVFDLSEPLSAEDGRILQELSEREIPTVAVLNKNDLPAGLGPLGHLRPISPYPHPVRRRQRSRPGIRPLRPQPRDCRSPLPLRLRPERGDAGQRAPAGLRRRSGRAFVGRLRDDRGGLHPRRGGCRPRERPLRPLPPDRRKGQ